MIDNAEENMAADRGSQGWKSPETTLIGVPWAQIQ